MNRIGIDLGGTKIEGILLDDELNVLNRKRISTDREKGYSEILERIVSLITDLTFGIEDIYSMGICTPGAISLKSGRLKNSNTLCLIGQPIKEDLEDRLNKKVKIENDANCFALAETMMGASKGYNFVFGIIMGTGVGGGIVCTHSRATTGQPIDNRNTRRISHVIGIRLKCQPPNRKMFATQIGAKCLVNFSDQKFLLIVVYLLHRFQYVKWVPRFFSCKDQGVDVLWKAGAAVSTSRIDKLIADPRVGTNAKAYRLHVSPESVRQIRYFVH